jgi:putative ABC transport system permease protein
MTWYRRLLEVLRPGRRAAEIEREIEFHLAELTDDLVAAGMTRSEARREARRRFGNPEWGMEVTHHASPFAWFESVLTDLRYALRALRRSPGFSAVAILSLGLGIGANTAIFSIYNALILRTLPVEHPEELLQITFGDGRIYFTNPLWEELRDQQDIFDGILAFGGQTINLADGGEVRNVPGSWVSGGFFHTLGVRPFLGRLLTENDDYRGCPPVAVVSHGFWQRELGGAMDVVGGTLMLNGMPFEALGVVQPTFTGVDVGRATDIYLPICAEPILSPGSTTLDARSTWFLQVIGRPAQGLSETQAGARLSAMSSSVFGATVPELWDTEGQNRYRAYSFGVRSARSGVSRWRGQYQSPLLVLLAIVGVVLLIACANVANLMLARGTTRQHEISVRRAIGSGRGRLIRLLVIESLVLSLISAAVAVVFARWGSSFLVGLLSPGDSLWLDLAIDFRVLEFTLGVATLTGVLFGLAPAWRASGVAPQSALRTAGRGVVDRRGRMSGGRTLVVGQLALSFSLVVGAGLLIGSLQRLVTLDPGFDRDHVLLVSVTKTNTGYSPEESRAVDRDLIERMRALPGVVSASAARVTPIGGSTWNDYVEADGFEPLDRTDALVWFNSTSEGFFSTLQIPFRAGRDFSSLDGPGSVPVAIINETMAGRFFPGSDPLGQTFRLEPSSGDPQTYQVIGVVADTKYETIDEEMHPIAYLPLSQEADATPWNGTRFQIRTDVAPASYIPQVKALIADVHPRISIRFTTLADEVSASLTQPRILAVLSGFFGAVALLLAMIGLYGTLSYRVVSRRNEIGLRMALGGTQGRVLGMVMSEVGKLVGIGIGLGMVCALGCARLLSAFLFGVSATDPRSLVLPVVLLSLVSAVAGALPALRAARLDPMVALREE